MKLYLYKYTSYLLLGYFLLGGCTSKSPKSPPNETVAPPKPAQTHPVDSAVVPAPKVAPPTPLKTVKPAIKYATTCKGQDMDLAEPIMSIAQHLEAQKLKYSSADTTDCSGIFHRVLWELAEICPAQKFPSIARYRDSRSIALWYHQHQQLHIVRDPLEMAEMIRPGAVMFYGKEGDDYSDATVDELMVQGKGIGHLGIVVEVKKDKKGRVTQYFLFHGRNRKHPASITSFHRRKPSRKKYPILGDGPNPWVAIAPILVGE